MRLLVANKILLGAAAVVVPGKCLIHASYPAAPP